MESELFSGAYLVMIRPQPHEDDTGYPFAWHFNGRRRTMEFRVQGRFRRTPNGPLFGGLVAHDYNYDAYDFDYNDEQVRLQPGPSHAQIPRPR